MLIAKTLQSVGKSSWAKVGAATHDDTGRFAAGVGVNHADFLAFFNHEVLRG
jgi:hypothetical protein